MTDKPAEIFISYRHKDTAGHVDRLHDALVDKYGKAAVFMDQTLEPGGDFPDEIEEAARNSKIGLVVIGSAWIDIKDDAGNRRLENENDWVAKEVKLLLEHVPRVVPLLIDGAKPLTREELPEDIAKLADKEAFGLSRKGWKDGLKRLVRKMDRWLWLERPRPRLYRAASVSALVALVVMLLVWWTQFLNVVQGYPRARAALDKWIWAWAGPPLGADGVALIVHQAPVEEDERVQEARHQRRLEHALLIKGLSQAGAGVIVLDYFYDRPGGQADEKLEEAIAGSRSPVVVGVEGESDDITEDLKKSVGDRWGLVDVRYNEVAGYLPGIEIARIHPPLPGRPGEILPALPLRAYMLHVGATRVAFDHGTESMLLRGKNLETLVQIPVTYAEALKDQTLASLPALLMTVPLGDDVAIKRYDYDEILADLRAAHPSLGEDLARDFRGRVVVIGSTSEKRLPAELGSRFGHEVQAEVVANLLRGRYARRSKAAGAFGIVVAVLLGVVWRLRPGRPEEIVESRSPYRHWVLALLDLLGGTLALAILSLLVALSVFRFTLVRLPLWYWLSAFALTYLLVTVAERRKFSS